MRKQSSPITVSEATAEFIAQMQEMENALFHAQNLAREYLQKDDALKVTNSIETAIGVLMGVSKNELHQLIDDNMCNSNYEVI